MPIRIGRAADTECRAYRPQVRQSQESREVGGGILQSCAAFDCKEKARQRVFAARHSPSTGGSEFFGPLWPPRRMHRGVSDVQSLAQLVGMPKLEGPQTIAEQFERYLAEYDNYDYFFIHYKYTDMYGEDGNFAAKRKAIEELDAALPILLRRRPDVLAITGDHRHLASSKVIPGTHNL